MTSGSWTSRNWRSSDGRRPCRRARVLSGRCSWRPWREPGLRGWWLVATRTTTTRFPRARPAADPACRRRGGLAAPARARALADAHPRRARRSEPARARAVTRARARMARRHFLTAVAHAATLPRHMAKVCHSCGKGPHSGTAAATRWSPPSAGSTRTFRRCGSSRWGAAPRVRLHALPEGRQGHQGGQRPVGPLPRREACPTRAWFASARLSRARLRTSSRGARRSTTSTSSRSPTAIPETTWR